LICFITVRYSC